MANTLVTPETYIRAESDRRAKRGQTLRFPHEPLLQLNNHRLEAGGLELRTESPDTRRLNDAF